MRNLPKHEALEALRSSTTEKFVKRNLPKHEAHEALRTLIAAPPEQFAKSFKEYTGAFSATLDTKAQQPTNLLDLYVTDIREIYQDMMSRPDHYDTRLTEIVNEMALGGTSATDEEKNALLVVFMQRTAEKKKPAATRPKEEDDTVMMDGQLLSNLDADLIFEHQSPGDKILI